MIGKKKIQKKIDNFVVKCTVLVQRDMYLLIVCQRETTSNCVFFSFSSIAQKNKVDVFHSDYS
jgi:hypothetical protein